MLKIKKQLRYIMKKSLATDRSHEDQELTKSHPIIEGIDVVMVSRTMDSDDHSKNESNQMENDSEKVTEMEVEEIIEHLY